MPRILEQCIACIEWQKKSWGVKNKNINIIYDTIKKDIEVFQNQGIKFSQHGIEQIFGYSIKLNNDDLLPYLYKSTARFVSSLDDKYKFEVLLNIHELSLQ